MSDVEGRITQADQATRRRVGNRRATAGDDAGGPVRLGATELGQVKLDSRPAGAPVVGYLGPGLAPAAGAAVDVRPLTDRAPAMWSVPWRPARPVGSQSVLGVNGYVYGPYSRQDEWTGPGLSGVYASPIPMPVTLVGSILVLASSVYAWARPTASLTVVSSVEPETTQQPISAAFSYNFSNPDGSVSGLLALAGATAPPTFGASATDPPAAKDDIPAIVWRRTDGMPSGAWLAAGAPGYIRFDIYYQVQGFGTFDFQAIAQGSVRRGSDVGAAAITRANAFASIPGYV
jgi:hypothetical protein